MSDLGNAILARLQDRHPFPLSMTLVLTGRCNATCPHCYLPPAGGEGDLNTGEWIAVLDELREAGVFWLLLTGGEPALRPDLLDIVEASSERGFITCLKSNALLLTAGKTERLRRAGLHEIQVSLYHDDPREHDRFVGRPGAFERAMHAIERFPRSGGEVTVCVMAMNWNTEAALRLERRFRESGTRYVIDFRLSLRTDGHDGPVRFRPTGEQVADLYRESPFWNAVLARETRFFDPHRRICGAGFSDGAIAPDGQVWPCLALPLALGNVRRARFRDIWISAKQRDAMKQLAWGAAPECAGCGQAPYCMRCPGQEFAEAGRLGVRSPYHCELAEMRRRARARRAEG